MEQIIIGGIVAFCLTFLSIPVIIKVANEKKLFDEPDDIRKIHKRPIPSLGGFAIFIGLVLCLLLSLNFTTQAPEFQYYIAAFLITFFVGVKDDILILSASKKILGQILVASILVFKAQLVITNMHGFFGIEAIDAYSSCFLTLFAMIVIMNAFNLIDGVDGLAGSIGLLTSAIFGIYFIVNGNIPYAVLGIGFAASLLAFLHYNFHPAKIFMGDTGSLMIGLVNSILVVKFVESAATYTHFPITAAPAVGFGILLLPLMDTLRVFAIRISKGKSPFAPDRNHIHHLLLDRGFNHRSVTLTCAAATAILSALAFYFQRVGTTYLIGGLILFFFSWVTLLYFKRSRYKLRVIKGETDGKSTLEEEKTAVRLVSLFTRKAAVVEED